MWYVITFIGGIVVLVLLVWVVKRFVRALFETGRYI